MTTHEELKAFENKIKAIDIKVGGCAVIKKGDRHFLLEHPTEQIYTINGDFFYNHKLDTVDDAELLFKCDR